MGIPLLNLSNSKPIVLSIYRTLLRNIPLSINSLNYQRSLRTIIRDKIKSEFTKTYAGNKNVSLNNSLKLCIRELKNLNNRIIKNDLPYLKRFQMVNSPEAPPVHIKNEKPLIEDPKITYEKKILHEFIRFEQFKSFSIPLPGKEPISFQSLKPLAVHRYYTNRLQYVEKILSKPPKTFVKGTRSYFGRMWFLTNFLTNKHNQSKKLSKFLGLTRKSGEYYLSLWSKMGDARIDYSIMEAQWEHELGETLRAEQQETQRSTFIPHATYKHEAMQILGDTKHSVYSWKPSNYHSEKTPEVNQWMHPLYANFERVAKTVKRKSNNLSNFKVNVIPKLYTKRQNAATVVYNNNITRWNKMCREDLPYCNPFDPENDLKSILLKYNFLQKKKSITSC